jgi:hypothetical protein
MTGKLMRRLLSLALLLPLAGCGTDDPAFIAISCPTSSVLAQAAFVTKFGQGQNGAPAPMITAHLEPGQIGCDYDQGDSRVTFDILLPITVTRAPAGTPGPYRLTYFVAVLDPAGNMLSKRIFERDIFLGASYVGNFNERVRDTSITLGQGLRPFQYQVLTGFQLTPAELAYNQTQRNFQP